ncbi:hypothetical protein [Cryobacterium cryoconiti]|uniref:Uncharacterized protein n=1 Tax=Cryobacterium cryoconiti TaxID=1259239 RepID=A0A4Y8JTG5_9MICO|nr:hypothetical protein [Cryobacterium cryoconiti]TFD29584.1 hypothetical protein E3T49_09155 [Cryobacterium cryoconiti]
MPIIVVLSAILGPNGDIHFSHGAFTWFGTQPSCEKKASQALPAQRFRPDPARHSVPGAAEPVLTELFRPDDLLNGSPVHEVVPRVFDFAVEFAEEAKRAGLLLLNPPEVRDVFLPVAVHEGHLKFRGRESAQMNLSAAERLAHRTGTIITEDNGDPSGACPTRGSVGVESINQDVAVDSARSRAIRQGEPRFHSVVEGGDCRQESSCSRTVDQGAQQTRDKHPVDLDDILVGESVVVPGDPVLRVHATSAGRHEVHLVGPSTDDGQTPQNSSRFVGVDGASLSGGPHSAHTQKVPIAITDRFPAGCVDGNATPQANGLTGADQPLNGGAHHCQEAERHVRGAAAASHVGSQDS